jgi:phosphotransferase system HPr (HPr) family protein
MADETAVGDVVVTFESGLHARPAARIVQTASSFEGEISFRTKDREVSGKSILGLLTLGATRGEHLTIKAKGPDAPAAVQAIVALFGNS